MKLKMLRYTVFTVLLSTPLFANDTLKLINDGKNSDFNCEMCHQQGRDYLTGNSLHHQREMECGQCHTLKKNDFNPSKFHPEVNVTYVSDKTCAGCHNEQYQQILQSEIYASAVTVDNLNLVANRRKHRGDGTKARYTMDGKFIKGQLCVTCHYNDHKFGKPDHSKVAVGSLGVQEYIHENGQVKKIITHKISNISVSVK